MWRVKIFGGLKQYFQDQRNWKIGNCIFSLNISLQCIGQADNWKLQEMATAEGRTRAWRISGARYDRRRIADTSAMSGCASGAPLVNLSKFYRHSIKVSIFDIRNKWLNCAIISLWTKGRFFPTGNWIERYKGGGFLASAFFFAYKMAGRVEEGSISWKEFTFLFHVILVAFLLLMVFAPALH